MVLSIPTRPDSAQPDYNLKAIVDIGSNGIRFSISSTDPVHARIFPCLYKDRSAISLFDSQHDPINFDLKNSKKKRKDGKLKSKKMSQGLYHQSQYPFSDKSATGSTAASTAIGTSTTSPVENNLQSGVDPSVLLSNTASTLFAKKTLDRFPVSPEEANEFKASNNTSQNSQNSHSPSSNKHDDTGIMTIEEAEAAAKAADSDKNDIPEHIIHDVVYALLRFKAVCEDFKVPAENIKVMATEATREATNSEQFRQAIEHATGWQVILLSKVEEAKCGAYGVLSSFYRTQGLFMDLSGGSMLLSWIACSNGKFQMSETPVSLPYGAAALTRRLMKTPPANTTVAEATEKLYEEIKVRFKDAFQTINVPEEMMEEARKSGGFKLFVSGGGFRGLGNLLLSKASSINCSPTTTTSTKGTATPNTLNMEDISISETSPESDCVTYPIPIINGFSCTTEPLEKLIQELGPLNISANAILNPSNITSLDEQNSAPENNEETALSVLMHRQMIITGGKKKLFRISERRAHQLPAVMLLVRAILETISPIRKVLFSQGGIQEGVLFSGLPNEIRMEDPLVVATRAFKSKSADGYREFLVRSLPGSLNVGQNDNNNNNNLLNTFLYHQVPSVIRDRLLEALANTTFIHSSYPKELQARVAMEIAVTGVIADTHGLSHEVRALLGLALSQRWGGETPDKTMKIQLLSLLSNRKLGWWALYVGHVLHVIGGVYPGGTIRDLEGDEKQKIFSLRTEPVADTKFDPNLATTILAATATAADIDEFGDSVGRMGGSGSFTGKLGKKSKAEDRRVQFTLRITASTTSPRTAAPMVRSRINNLEKKLKKLSKEFGKDACKVNVIVDWV